MTQLNIPLIVIWRANDLNVDAINDATIYERLLTDHNTDARIVVWPNATHGLLKSNAYNWQLIEDWSWLAKLRFIVEERYAFASGSLEAVTTWIFGQSHNK